MHKLPDAPIRRSPRILIYRGRVGKDAPLARRAHHLAANGAINGGHVNGQRFRAGPSTLPTLQTDRTTRSLRRFAMRKLPVVPICRSDVLLFFRIELDGIPKSGA
jgi:hypothetical protein